jgi:hypothetical protein
MMINIKLIIIYCLLFNPNTINIYIYIILFKQIVFDLDVYFSINLPYGIKKIFVTHIIVIEDC